MIHHYTSVKNLSLILKNRTLRFGRADQLDDPSEVPFRTDRLGPHRFFVSSWCQGLRGEAGLWHRYADRDHGVRLSLPRMPFDWTRYAVEFSRMCNIHGHMKKIGVKILDVVMPFGEETLFGNGYMVTPTWTDLPNAFGAPVIYVDDPITEAAKTVVVDGERLTIHGDSNRLARVKGLAWSDQDEYRFVLSAIGGPKLDYAEDPARYREAMMDIMESGAKIGFDKFHPDVPAIFVPFGANAFVGMTVTLGPQISTEDRIMVTQLVHDLAPSASVVESKLRTRIRPSGVTS